MQHYSDAQVIINTMLCDEYGIYKTSNLSDGLT